MKKIWIVPAVAIAAVLGFSLQRWMGGAGESAATAVTDAARTTETTGVPAADAGASGSASSSASVESAVVAASAGAGAPADAPAIPTVLPAFKLADREGRLRGLDDWKGRPLLVNYWATWCAPCRREIPLLNELRAEARAPRLEVVGIAVDFREDVLKYASETPISYPLLIGEEDGLEAVTAMGMQPAFPFTVFADSQQRILTVKIGELHRDEADLILDQLAGVDAGTIAFEQARARIDAGLKELAAARAAKAATG